MSEFNGVQPWGGLKRVILNPNGERIGYLDSNNSNLWEDGTEVDWITVENSGQNVMVEVPKFYYTKKVAGDDIHFGVADKPVDTDKIATGDWKVHSAFYRDRTKLCDDQSANPIEVDYRYIGAFHGQVDGSGRLRSLPNKTATANKTIGAYRTHAKNMG